jgi:SAM-dependent methyltransferase
MESAVRTWAAGQAAERVEALLLGVTPLIAGMQWPRATRLLAVDSSAAMLHAVWPGDIPRRRYGVCASWLDLPQSAHSSDVAIGDGSMNCLRYPDGFRRLCESVCRVLKTDGIFVLRCYVQPDSQEDPDTVFAGALTGTIPTFHQFKFRLLMALQASTQDGIKVDDVYRYWASRPHQKTDWPSRAGWSREDVETMDLYRGSSTVHTFPTQAEWHAALHEFFEEVSISTSPYYLAERCPTMVLRPRRG